MLEIINFKNVTRFVFPSQQTKTVAGLEMIVFEVEMTKENMPLQGLIAMLKKGNSLFQLNLTAEKKIFPSQRSEFNKIVQSFTVK